MNADDLDELLNAAQAELDSLDELRETVAALVRAWQELSAGGPGRDTGPVIAELLDDLARIHGELS